jgi:hypothetical protein
MQLPKSISLYKEGGDQMLYHLFSEITAVILASL